MSNTEPSELLGQKQTAEISYYKDYLSGFMLDVFYVSDGSGSDATSSSIPL